MIWESHPWRAELVKVADRLARQRERGTLTEAGAFRLERDLMVGAYAIRKLMEAKKLATSLEQTTYRVRCYPSTGERPDRMNWHHLDRFYDFGNAGEATLSLGQLCNQIVHSWIWMPLYDWETKPKGWEALLVTSDRDRMKHIHEIPSELFVDLFRQVGTEDVASVRMTRDAAGDWVVFAQTREEVEASEGLPDFPPGLLPEGLAPSIRTQQIG